MTTSTPDFEIRRLARRAYERARALNSIALGVIVATPPMLLSTGCCTSPGASVLCGLGLLSAIAAARYAGQGSEAALRPGLVAGVLAFAFPLACHGLMSCSNGMCLSPRLKWVPFVAIAAGFLGGVVLRFRGRRGSRVVAGSTALLLGSMGSLVAGFAGPLWTGAGLLIGSMIPTRAVAD